MKEEVFIEKRRQLDDRIRAAWKDMHHNASIARFYPDFRNDYESELFWSWLGTEVATHADHIETVLAKKFCISTKVYSAGRSGATMYPEEFHRSIGCGSFGTFKWDYFHRRFVSDAAELRERANVASALEWFNGYWRREAAKVTARWKRYKRDCGMSREIASYDGKTKRYVEVWS